MGANEANLWPHHRLLAAAAGQDWAALFRAYRQLTGTSQTRLGELVGLAQPDVSAIERGHRQVTSREVIQRITTGLAVPPHLLAAPPPDTGPMPALALSGIAPDGICWSGSPAPCRAAHDRIRRRWIGWTGCWPNTAAPRT